MIFTATVIVCRVQYIKGSLLFPELFWAMTWLLTLTWCYQRLAQSAVSSWCCLVWYILFIYVTCHAIYKVNFTTLFEKRSRDKYCYKTQATIIVCVQTHRHTSSLLRFIFGRLRLIFRLHHHDRELCKKWMNQSLGMLTQVGQGTMY